MQNRLEATRIGYRYASRLNPEVSDANPLANTIMEEPIPQNFVIPKIAPFTGSSDPKLHLKAFQAQMLISGGNDAIRCKMFVGTLAKIALKWFNTILSSSINSFTEFKRVFLERFSANRAKPVEMADMFDIRQYAEESLKQFFNRFTNISMRVVDPNEGLLVKAFVKGLRASSFGKSLYWIPPKTLMEIRQRAAVEIETEEAMRHKKAGDKRTLTHTKSERDIKTSRRERTPPRTRTDCRFVPYVAQQRTEYRQTRRIPDFRLTPAEILEDTEISKYLRYPNNTRRTLGSRPNAWCKFHQAGGHDTNSCYALNNQLSVLADRGLMGKYIKSNTDVEPFGTRSVLHLHETLVLGDFNTIAGGFAGGGQTSSARKRYVRSVMTTAKIERPKKVSYIVFSSEI